MCLALFDSYINRSWPTFVVVITVYVYKHCRQSDNSCTLVDSWTQVSLTDHVNSRSRLIYFVLCMETTRSTSPPVCGLTEYKSQRRMYELKPTAVTLAERTMAYKGLVGSWGPLGIPTWARVVKMCWCFCKVAFMTAAYWCPRHKTVESRVPILERHFHINTEAHKSKFRPKHPQTEGLKLDYVFQKHCKFNYIVNPLKPVELQST